MNRSRSPEHVFRIHATRVGSRRPSLRFEPTPQQIVTAMLELADVHADDIVYDLGSGDGRVPIAAVRDFGARAVGIEKRPDLVETARHNARAAGLTGRIRFLQQDLFDADIRSATVVTLFLSAEVNLMLRT